MQAEPIDIRATATEELPDAFKVRDLLHVERLQQRRTVFQMGSQAAVVGPQKVL